MENRLGTTIVSGRRAAFLSVSAAALLLTGFQAAQAETALIADESQSQVDRISVVATRTPRPAFTYPGSVSVLDRDAISDFAASSIADIFDSVPGVTFAGGPRRTGEVPTVRGISGAGVLVLFDGVRQNFLSGHDGRFFIDPDLLRAVEVVRGASSALYGSGALGGVIAFQTLTADDLLNEDEHFGFELKTGFQGVNDEILAGGTLFGRGMDGRLDGVASLTFRSSDDIDLATGDVLRSDDELYSSLVKGSYEITDGITASATWIGYNGTAQEPNNGQGLNSGDLVDKDSESNTVRAGLTFNPADRAFLDGELFGYYTSASVDEAELDSPRVISREVESFGLVATNTSRFTLAPGATLALTYGAEVYEDEQTGTDNQTTDGTRGGVPNATARTYGGFVQADLALDTPLGLVTAIPGLRYDRFITEGDFDTEDSAFSPKIGVSLAPMDGLLLFGSYAEAFRAPAINEIFADGVHFTIPLDPGVDAPNFFIANPDLEPESSATWEAGAGLDRADVFLDGDQVILKGTYYRTHAENLIDLDVDVTFAPSCFAPGLPFPCTAGTSRNANVRNAFLEGVEVEGSHETDWTFLTLSYTRIEGFDEDTGDFLGLLNPDRVFLNAGVKVAPWDLRIGTRMEFATAFTKVNDPSEARDGYQVFDLYAVWQPLDGPLAGLRLDLGVDNLFDEEYERVFAGVPEPGRNLKLSARWRQTY